MGDWNGRTSNHIDYVKQDGITEELMPDGYVIEDEYHEEKIFTEENLNSDVFGKPILDLCRCSNVRIMNGTFGYKSAKFTCRKWNGSSVVDHAIVSH